MRSFTCQARKDESVLSGVTDLVLFRAATTLTATIAKAASTCSSSCRLETALSFDMRCWRDDYAGLLAIFSGESTADELNRQPDEGGRLRPKPVALLMAGTDQMPVKDDHMATVLKGGIIRVEDGTRRIRYRGRIKT